VGAKSAVQAYVINLVRSADRRSRITAELKNTGIDYEIVTAVDGRDLDLNDIAKIDPAFLKIEYPAGAAGCALSHLKVYAKIIADGLDKALVLEDDVILPADLMNLAAAVAEHLTAAEIALLNFDSPEPVRISSEGAIRLLPARLLALPIDISQVRSAAAYVITREACERMVKSALPIQVLADAWWHFYREGALDRVRCVAPLPVRKNTKFVSTIGFYSLGGGLSARLAEPLVRREIPLLSQALSYRRERIYRQFIRSELIAAPFIERPSRLD
jgi:glycosyl transferase, family 25